MKVEKHVMLKFSVHTVPVRTGGWYACVRGPEITALSDANFWETTRFFDTEEQALQAGIDLVESWGICETDA